MTHTDYTSEYLPDFAYTEADVQANRQGLLTAEQAQIIEAVYQARQRGVRLTFRLFAIWIPVLLVVGMVIEYNNSGKSLDGFLPDALPIMLLVGGGLTFILFLAWGYSYLNARDARDKRVSMAQGVAKVLEQEAQYRNRSPYMRYELRLNGRLFRFANHASIAHFEEGKTYRVYYIKYNPFPLMLSAELV